jgi:hypothetical protein
MAEGRRGEERRGEARELEDECALGGTYSIVKSILATDLEARSIRLGVRGPVWPPCTLCGSAEARVRGNECEEWASLRWLFVP